MLSHYSLMYPILQPNQSSYSFRMIPLSSSCLAHTTSPAWSTSHAAHTAKSYPSSKNNENVPPPWCYLSLFSNLKEILFCPVIPLTICLLTPYKITAFDCILCFFFLYMISANWLTPWRKFWLLFVNILKTFTLLPTT